MRRALLRRAAPLVLVLPAMACTDDGARPVPAVSASTTTGAVPTMSAPAGPVGYIAYVRDVSLGEVFVVPADGSAPPRRLTRDGAQDDSPTFSPDGTTIAFVSFQGGDPEIHTIRRDGTGRRQLTSNGGADDSPAFSPDGSRIAFVSDRGGDAEIFVMDADGRRQAALTRNRDIDHAPSFSRDGRRIVFVSKRDHDPVANYEVYLMESDGTAQRRLTRHRADSHEAVLGPRGDVVAFVSWRSGREALYVVGVGGGEPRRVGSRDETAVGAPVFSPDGTRVVYAAQVDGDWDLFSVEVSGTTRTRLTAVPGVDAAPTFSPDGAHIAFTSLRAGDADVWVMRADGSGQRRLTTHPGSESGPAWGRG